MRKKDVYEKEMYKIYNRIVGQTNKQLQEKAALESTFQAVKTGLIPHWVPNYPEEALIIK